MTEDEAWDELERKQQKKAKPVTEREALRISYNALIEIDKQTPYPLAKHAVMVINSVLSISATDWEAIAADQALTIATLRQDVLDEREACAKLCESEGHRIDASWESCAAAIRGRTE